MSIEGQRSFLYHIFSRFVCFVLYQAKVSGERLQDNWSSGLFIVIKLELITTTFKLIGLITIEKLVKLFCNWKLEQL